MSVYGGKTKKIVEKKTQKRLKFKVLINLGYFSGALIRTSQKNKNYDTYRYSENGHRKP